nr:hypothetical protein GCM10020093_000740 [Planobispora longispora]
MRVEVEDTVGDAVPLLAAAAQGVIDTLGAHRRTCRPLLPVNASRTSPRVFRPPWKHGFYLLFNPLTKGGKGKFPDRPGRLGAGERG